MAFYSPTRLNNNFFVSFLPWIFQQDQRLISSINHKRVQPRRNLISDSFREFKSMTFLHQWAKESPICVILFILQCSREKMPKHYKSNMIEHVRSIFLKINEQDERLEKHENMLQENADLIKGVDKRVGDLEKIANSQLIWRIEDYTRKLKEAKAGNGDTLFSPTFTTSKHGYRLCASVCLNGDGKGKGSHMSVFISVLRGEKRFSTWITHSRFPAH